jgi:hypothetical protein
VFNAAFIPPIGITDWDRSECAGENNFTCIFLLADFTLQVSPARPAPITIISFTIKSTLS